MSNDQESEERQSLLQVESETDNNLTDSDTCKDKVSLTLCPCKHFNDAKVTRTDCLTCCHEAALKEVSIPPLIEMAGTYIGTDPIPIWFIILRTILTILMIYIFLFRFIDWSLKGNAGYFWIYFTQWTHTLCTASMIIKTICTFKVHAKRRREDCNLSEALSSDDPMWKLYIWNSVLLQMSIPAVGMLVLNYFAFVCKFKWASTINAVESLQIHGVNFILVWLDFYLSAERMYYKSWIWPFLLGTLYTIWTIIFELTLNMNEEGDPYIYSTYDWSKSMEPIIYFFLSALIMTVFTFIATFTKNLIFICKIQTIAEWDAKMLDV